ncbi:hypothetical protein [Pseudomonas cichorii]|uniref:hypothetical protein n=1 Tax=Pseudomonas cichorii TaxID=36746 RepID=UPI001C8A506F|nr:hypothetical protein [Pseudomonas cichorii]MBX8576965.1 hypothetical protein [Pseudomonas cichorii]
MFYLGVVFYVVVGGSLYSLTSQISEVGSLVSRVFSWFFLDAGIRISTYQFVGFAWSTLCHALWAVFFSERTEGWVGSLRFSNVIYLFFRMIVFLFFSVLILGFVGMGVSKKPFSEFHQYCSVLVPCLLLGGWVWSVRDFLIAAFNYRKGAIL